MKLCTSRETIYTGSHTLWELLYGLCVNHRQQGWLSAEMLEHLTQLRTLPWPFQETSWKVLTHFGCPCLSLPRHRPFSSCRQHCNRPLCLTVHSKICLHASQCFAGNLVAAWDWCYLPKGWAKHHLEVESLMKNPKYTLSAIYDGHSSLWTFSEVQLWRGGSCPVNINKNAACFLTSTAVAVMGRVFESTSDWVQCFGNRCYRQYCAR